MTRRQISIKRRKRKSVVLTVFCIVGIAVVCFIWRTVVDKKKHPEVTFKPVSEETTIHMPDVKAAPVVFKVRETKLPETRFSETDVTMVAKTVWGEARGIASQTEQAAVVWCILNRYDKHGGTISDIVTAPNQFNYDDSFEIVDDTGRDLTELVRDVFARWEREKAGQNDTGRVLPKEYLYFSGNGEHNIFRTEYESFDNTWEWLLPSPYKE